MVEGDYEQILSEWNTIEEEEQTEGILATLTARLVQVLQHENRGTNLSDGVMVVVKNISGKILSILSK